MSTGPIIKIEGLARTITLFGRTRTEPGAAGEEPVVADAVLCHAHISDCLSVFQNTV